MNSNNFSHADIIILIIGASVIIIDQLFIIIYVQRVAHRIKTYNPSAYPALFPGGLLKSVYGGLLQSGFADSYFFNMRLVKNDVLVNQLTSSTDPILQSEGSRLNRAFNTCNLFLYSLIIIPIFMLLFNKS